jgi:hypothetical protein
MPLIQYLKLKRGVPEVILTVDFEGNASAVLAEGVRLVRSGCWPAQADGLRVIDQYGRILMSWDIPAEAYQLTSTILSLAPQRKISEELVVVTVPDSAAGEVLPPGSSRVDVGQPVSYADNREPGTWKGGYEIIGLPVAAPDDAVHYLIRNANEPYNLVVQEHELREDLGARLRGR